MKQLAYFILFLFIGNFSAFGQDCEIIIPDQFQVLPAPDTVGYWDEACVNELYQKTLQVIVPDSLSVSGIDLDIDSIVITGVEWAGTPISYTATNGGSIPDNSIGYISFSYTPTTLGVDSITIELDMYFNSAVLPQVTITLPDPVIADGAFSVLVKQQGTCNPKPANSDLCFIASETEPCDSTSIYFFSSAFGSSISYDWSFPGGTPSGSGSPSPTVYYPTVGSFDVTLITLDSDTGIRDTVTYADYIQVKNDPTCYTLASYFTADYRNICDSSYVYFTNRSTGRNPSPYWEFPGGVPSTSTDQNPYVYYENPGTYDVTLTVSNSVTSNSLTRSDYITVYSDADPECEDGVYQCIDYGAIDLGADCSWDSGTVCGCNGIEYTSSCIALYCFGVTSWTAGPCDNDNGNGGGGVPSDSTCNLDVSFTYTGELGTEAIFDFVANVTGGDGNYVYSWDFGDGNFANDSMETHAYPLIDSLIAYTVCLEVFDLSGCFATTCETLVIDGSPGGTIGGTVVDGTNLNGEPPYIEQKNGSGDPLPNVQVDLVDVNGTVIQTAFTGAQGEYSFGELLFGNYWVKVVIPSITHEPTPIKLVPTRQRATNFGFEVNDTDVNPTAIDDLPGLVNIRLFPNPTAGPVELDLTFSTRTSVNISVNDILGQKVFSKQETFATGKQQITLPSNNWATGVYFVSLQSGQAIYTMKLLVE